MSYKLRVDQVTEILRSKVVRCAFWEEQQLPGIFPAFGIFFFKNVFCGPRILTNKIDFLKLFIRTDDRCSDSGVCTILWGLGSVQSCLCF